MLENIQLNLLERKKWDYFIVVNRREIQQNCRLLLKQFSGMGVGIKSIDWSIVFYVGKGVAVLVLYEVVSWNRTFCKVKKRMLLLVIMFVEIGLEKLQIEGSIRKYVNKQIYKWKECSFGEMKILILNYML